MGQAMKKDVKDFQDELRDRGWSVEYTNGGHYKYTYKNGDFFFGSSTPSDTRSVMNERMRAKRIERKAGGLAVVPKEKNVEERVKIKPKSRMHNGQKIEYGTDPR